MSGYLAFVAPEVVDKILLGNAVSPGRVTLRGHDRDATWDVKEASGQDGASSSYQGEPVGQFEAIFSLAFDPYEGVDELYEWDAFQRVIDGMTAGPSPIALPIYHPDLARNRYTEVSRGMVGGMVRDGKGGATVTVKFIEYRPPKPKPATNATGAAATASGSGRADGGAQPAYDPNAERRARVQELWDEAQEP
jgi:hypothetical protein